MFNTRISFTILLIFLIVLNIQAEKAENLFSELKYRNVGPTRGGRVTAVCGIHSQPSVFYMGTTGGGVWKTIDYGKNWKNVSDHYFKSPSIGAIQVSKTKPDIVYVGTGTDGIRSNVITGKGVYKSIDAGKTWNCIGLEKTGQIGAVEVDPNDENIVYVAAIGQAFNSNKERGVYKTIDGGKSWKKILYLSDTVGAVDIEISPSDPNTIYAAMWRVERKPWTIISGANEGGIYKSIDGGKHWNKLNNGLPKGLVGKIDLSVSRAKPNRLYALVEAEEGAGFYMSEDNGEHFQLVNQYSPLLDRPFYYCNIKANPLNADVIYSSATGFFKSVDGGDTWKRRLTPHGDNHDLWINENDTLIMIQSNDGGANISLDGGNTWSTQYNQATAELYQVELDDQYPYWLYAGQQDNSTIAVPSLPPYRSPSGPNGFWLDIGGCETGPAVPKPGNHTIVYSNCKGHFGVYSKITGQQNSYTANQSNIYGHNPKDLEFRFQRVSPIHVSPHNPDVVYHCSQYVHKTTDEGNTWEIISPDLTAFEIDKQLISGSPITRDVTGEEYYSAIYSIRESKLKEGVIWVGSNDGLIHLTNDGGKNWFDVTPANLPKGGRVDCVEPSPHHASKAYVSVLRYQLGDWKPYVYKTLDNGQNWELITGIDSGFPMDYPVRVVREDPEKEGLLYAGTEFGMFISFDDGNHWQSFQQNLPITPITDIKIYRNDLILSTMGRSFWIMDNVSPLRDYKNLDANYLIKAVNTIRYRYRANSPNVTPYYPSATAAIDYYLSEDIASEIVLNIYDSKSNLIQRYTSTEHESKEDAENRMYAWFYTPSSKRSLKNTKGLHRVNWDMKHQGSWDENSIRAFDYGPFVAPGMYHIELVIKDQVLKTEIEISSDPRLKVIGVSNDDLIAQETLAIKVRDLSSRSKKLILKIKNAESDIEAKIQKKRSKSKWITKKLKLNELYDQLVMAKGRYQQPKSNDQINFLNRSVNAADQKPSENMYAKYEELLRLIEKFENAYENL